MWLVVKLKNINKFNEAKIALTNLLNKNSEFYFPKIKKNYFKGNKKFYRDYYILENYIFVFNKEFKKKEIINQINHLSGVQYILSGYNVYQSEINKFVENCKENENEEGFLMQSFFDLFCGKDKKFKSGPFINYIARIISLNKNKISALVGNYTITVSKKSSSILL